MYYHTQGSDAFWGDSEASLIDNGWFATGNRWAEKGELLGSLAEAGRGDMVVFEGHGNEEQVRVDGSWTSGWREEGVFADDMVEAVSADGDAPSVVILATCGSGTAPADGESMIARLADAGVGVAFGWDGTVNSMVARRVATELVERLSAGETIHDAVTHANRFSHRLGNTARLEYRLGDGVRAGSSLEGNGLKLSGARDPRRSNVGSCSVSGGVGVNRKSDGAVSEAPGSVSRGMQQVDGDHADVVE